jgi:hypothetical protein
MHVVAHVHSYYDHEPVPEDFDTTLPEFEEALASGLAKRGAKGGYVVRVTRKERPTHVFAAISENEIMQRVLHHALPQNGSRIVSRKEAIEDYFTVRVLPEHAHPSFVTHFEVHDDGADEKTFRAFLAPYTAAKHAKSGEPIVPPEMLEPLVKAYLEPADGPAIVKHLHSKFRLPEPKAVTS